MDNEFPLGGVLLSVVLVGALAFAVSGLWQRSTSRAPAQCTRDGAAGMLLIATGFVLLVIAAWFFGFVPGE